MKAMRSIFALLFKYRALLSLSIISNILLSIFTIVSIPLIIPFFQILFEKTPPITERPENNFDVIAQLNYFFSQIVIQNDRNKALLYVCISIFLIFMLKNLFRYLAKFFLIPAKNGVIADLRGKIMTKYVHLPLLFFANEKKGDLISRISSDVLEIETSILSTIEAVFKAPIIILGSLFFMIYVSPSLTLFVLLLIFFTIFIIGGISRSLKRKSHKAQSFLADILSTVEESISGMRIIKAFSAEDFIQRKFFNQNHQYKRITDRIHWRRDLASPISEVLGISVVTILLFYGSLQVFNNNLEPETFFAFIFAFYYIIEPSKLFSSAYFNIQKGSAAIERINKILNLNDEGLELDGDIELSDFSSEISLQNLTFSYPDSEFPVINQINVKIKKGQHIAIVGSSGSGKTTLTNLIPLLYLVDRGQIFLDGIDIRDIKFTDLRKQFAIVTQEAILFHDTVLNNIRFGNENATMDELVECCKIANAYDFIQNLDQGFETIIGDRGSKLSGGQRQRITIARALLKNPSILILDEATSALDAESEKLVKEAMEKVIQNRTVITIAHKYSTIQSADLIIVLKDGKIVQKGNHQELMAMGGDYLNNLELQKV